MKILIEIRKIPLGSIVTKATGTKEYVIKDRVRIFKEGDEPKDEIIATEGTMFMCPCEGTGDINCVPDTKVIGWVVPQHIEFIIQQELSNEMCPS